ncbi:MAG: adenylyl-sulfate kinase, partial [Chitinivibrionales bacterium]|nr:adenylyl-sulfate kinase [Chitinivibrionales bacterium]MBD3357926.1 adenylyl-sulfate kinase [Chitinivibrionales bacterium]
WMDERRELSPENRYILQHTTQRTQAFVDEVVYQLDVNTLHRAPASTLALNEIGRVKITTAKQLFFDPYDRNRWTGGFILIDPNDFRTVASGMIRYSSRSTIDELKRKQRHRRLEDNPPSAEIRWDPGLVALEDRIRKNGHKPLCVWLTGLHGAGKSGIAQRVEKALFDRGSHVVRLDGENVRYGLNGDLDHTRDDRREHIRRVGHLCRLLYDFGNIVLCTFTSPHRSDRESVRSLFPAGAFVEVHVDVTPAQAEKRDGKGMYAKARRGELRGVAGADVLYEAPTEPEIYLDTEQFDVVTNAEKIIGFISAII